MKPAIGLLLSVLVSFSLSAQRAADFSVTHYTSENGLPQNSVEAIERDKNDFLWMSTESGLLRFDGQRFRLYDRAHYPILASNRVWFLRLTKDSLIGFGDEYNHLYAFNKNNQIIDLTKKEIIKFFGYYTGDFFRFKDKKVIFISTKLDRDTVLWRLPVPDLSETGFTQCTQSPQRFYFFNRKGEIFSIDKQKRRTRMRINGIIPELACNTKTNNSQGFFYQEGKIYMRQGKGIYAIEETGSDELKVSLMLETEEPDISVYRNYPSLNLQLIGSPTHGLYLYHRKQFQTHKHSNGYGIFYAQQPYSDSGVLTNGGPVFPSFSKFNYPFEIPGALKGMHQDRRGHYWVNKVGSVIKYVAELDKQLRPVHLLPAGNQGINCFGETPDGRIWLSSFLGDKIGYIGADAVYWLPQKYPYNSIITFLPLNNEELLLAGNKFLCRLNTRTGKETHYKALEQFTIETLYQDHNKVLWIGTSGSGFFALKGNRHYKLPLDNNGNLSNVHTFMEDRSGFIWMSTNNGLFRTRKADMDNYIAGKADKVYYQYFDKAWGFNTNEFNGSCTPSGIVLGNGKFSLPSLDGLVQFYPDSIRTPESGHTLIIDKLIVDGKEIFAQTSLTLVPSFNHLEIEIAAPYFGDPANQMIEYNVQGLDRNWYPVRADNKVTLNRLPYGKYSLQFRAQSGFGNEGKISLALPFTVTPFFYQTWYFKLITLFVVLFCIFFAVRFRYALLMKRNKKLEQEISIRTLGLQQANKLKEKMLMMVGHDLQSPLYFLGYLSQTNYDSLQRDDKIKAEEMSLAIKNTSGKIYAFVEEFHLWAKIQDEKYNLHKEVFALQSLLTELADFFGALLQQYGNIIQLQADRDYHLYTNRSLLKALLRNLIDNANKHTRNGVITITCIVDKGMGSITVADTGKGIAVTELNMIRQLITDTTSQSALDQNSRLGFQFIIDFTTRLELSLSIESEQEIGTQVCVAGLPLHTSEELVPQLVTEGHKPIPAQPGLSDV
jgi:signal transduction histidine kinase